MGGGLEIKGQEVYTLNGKREKRVRETGETGKNYTTLCNICNRKVQRGKSQQKRAGTREPGACFSKVPKAFQPRKAICKKLFEQLVLQSCFFNISVR